MNLIKGSNIKCFRDNMLIFNFFNFIFTFFLFGEYVLSPFIFGFLSFFCLKTIYILFKWKTNKFKINFEERYFENYGRRVYFNKIEGIEIVKFFDSYKINIVINEIIRIKMADYIAYKEKEAFLDVLKLNDITDIQNKIKTVNKTKYIFVYLFLILFILCTYLISINYLYKSNTFLKKEPIILTEKSINEERKEYMFFELGFKLPQQVEIETEEEDKVSFIYENDKNKRIVIQKNQNILNNFQNNRKYKFILRILELENDYVFFDKAYKAKYGIMFLVLKFILINSENQEIYYYKNNTINALLNLFISKEKDLSDFEMMIFSNENKDFYFIVEAEGIEKNEFISDVVPSFYIKKKQK